MTDPPETTSQSPAGTQKLRRRLRVVFRVVLLIVLVAAANMGARWLVKELDPEALLGHQRMMIGIVAASLFIYAVLIAVPFVPGVEIGLGLFALLGASMAPFVYLATIIGLCLAFLLGRLVPVRKLEALFSSLSLENAAALSARLAPLSREERLNELIKGAPRHWLPLLLKYRYLALAVSINIPGNSIVGGGGGLCLLAGMSGLFTFSAFVLTLAIAVAPVPVLVFFFGAEIIWF